MSRDVVNLLHAEIDQVLVVEIYPDFIGIVCRSSNHVHSACALAFNRTILPASQLNWVKYLSCILSLILVRDMKQTTLSNLKTYLKNCDANATRSFNVKDGSMSSRAYYLIFYSPN